MQPNIDPEALPPRQALALYTLLEGKTQAEAAAAAGVNRRTLARWLKTPGFGAALAQAQALALERMARRLETIQAESLETLAALLSHDDAWVRLKTAQTIGEQFYRLQELRTVNGRIEALEALAEELER